MFTSAHSYTIYSHKIYTSHASRYAFMCVFAQQYTCICILFVGPFWRPPGQLWGGNGDRIDRHNSLRDTLFSAAQSAALAPRKEVPSLIPGTSSRPADIFLPNWSRGCPATLDVTVISTLQSFTLVGAAATQGPALRVGENGRWLPTTRHACLWAWFSSHLWSNPWVAGAKR